MAPSVVQRKATLLDFSLVEKGIQERAAYGTPRNLAFSKYVLETVFDIPPADTLAHIVDGPNDRGIDIIYIDDGARCINIASCKTVIAYKKSNRNFPGEEIDKIVSFVGDLIYKREEILENVNGALAEKIRVVWELFSNDVYEIKVHLFSNQMTLAKAERDRLALSLAAINGVTLLEHGLYELAHGVVRATRPRFRKKLVPRPNCAYGYDECGYRAITTTVELIDLYRFLLNEEDKFDERLYHHNVRYFLGRKNSVNRDIRETLTSTSIGEFWFLNSGITIVCDQIISVSNGCHPITLVNPQIVNGGQTAHVVFEVGSETLFSINSGSVPIKIIETKDRNFIERVAIASNNQSRILGRDLRANESLQLRLAEDIRLSGYFYQRKRGEKPPKACNGVIDAARAGQLLLAYSCGEPTRSKTDSDNIFGELYEQAFPPQIVDANLVVACFLCHEKIEERRSEAQAWQRSALRNSYAETWIIEGHFHVLFVVGELLRRKNIPLTDSEAAISLLDYAMDVVEQFVRKHPGVSNYRLFRLASSREDILSILDGRDDPDFRRPVQLELGI